MNKQQAEDLLYKIQNDPDSFTQGRRNDDVVNWVLAKIMLGNFEDKVYTERELCNEWTKFYGGLAPHQKEDLIAWDDEVEDKIWGCNIYLYCDNDELETKLINTGEYFAIV